MLDIREALQANIRPAGVTNGLYYEKASGKATFPYLVFSFEPINTQDESSDSFILDLDGWDAPSNGSTTALETLMRTVDGSGDITNPTGLNYKVITTTKVTLILRRQLRYDIPDTDKTLKRRRYTYLVTSFERSES
jgi:hypothetical protein